MQFALVFSSLFSLVEATETAAAQYVLHNDFNVVEGTDANNAADLVGCQATGSEDVRNDPAKKQECLDECTKNSDCTGVVFHSKGSMLKKDVDGKTIDNMMVARTGFETYVKPSAKRCYGPGRADHKEYCETTCQTALNNDFLKGHGDSEASGICCWNDCEDQLYNGQKFACYCDEEESESTTSAPAVIRSLAEESEDSSDDNKEAAAQYVLHNDFNVVEGTDANNAADLVGCQATGSEDVRNDQAKKQECLDECTKNSDCTGVVFHSKGTMLKKNVDGKTIDNMMVARAGFETYVKPSAKRCHAAGRPEHDDWCETTCQTALNNDFLSGHGDAEASGICCWNDCENQLYNGQKFHCYCDDSVDQSKLLI